MIHGIELTLIPVQEILEHYKINEELLEAK
jgi:hypothetical protein